jgi:O-antigen/teichoic acid export membrane protein
LKQHISNASWGGFAAAFRAAYGLLNVLLAVRLLGAEAYGQAVALLAFFTLYCSLSTSIFTILVVKLVATPKGEDRSPLLASGWAWVVCSLSGLALLALAAILLATAPVGASTWMPSASTMHLVLALCALSSLQIVGTFQLAMIESSGRFDVATKSQLYGPILVLALLFGALVCGMVLATWAYIGVLCVGAAVDLALAWLARRTLMRMTRLNAGEHSPWRGLWQLLKSGSLLQATSLMNMFLEPLNKTLLNSLLGGTAVTVYDISMKLIWGIQSLFSSAMRVFLHIASQDRAQLGSSYLNAVRLVGVLVVLLHIVGCLLLVALGRYWLLLDTQSLAIFFAVATLSNVGMIGVGPLYNGIIGTGDMGFIFRVQARLAVINAVSSFCLIPVLGVLGAAFGLLLATLYNATAILRKGRVLVGNDQLLKDLLRSMEPRLVIAAGMFGAAVYCGINSDAMVPLGLALLVGVSIMFIHEPAGAYLFAKIRQRVFAQER